MRSLTSAISSNVTGDRMDAVFVFEIKYGSTVLVRASNRAIDDWDGVGADAEDLLVEIPPIRQTLDWRGGLSFFSEPEIKVADDGTLGAQLRDAMDLNIEGWFTLDDGTLAKTDAIQVYAGVVAGFSYAGNVITIRGGDRRVKRYPEKILSKVDLENESNLCGAGLQQSAVGTWGTTLQYREEWLPEATKEKYIPITFNRPDKCKLVQVSTWPGAEELGASYDIRGPVFVLSDLGLDYGTSLVSPVGQVFRRDSALNEFRSAVASLYNDLRDGQISEVTGPWPAVCIARTDADANAGKVGCVNFYERVWPHNRETVHSNVSGDWSSFFDRVYDWTHHHLLWTGANPISSERTTVVKLSFKDSRFPAAAQRFRHAYIEAFIEKDGGGLPNDFELRMRLTRNPDWSGDSDEYLDDVTIIDGSDGVFNNVEGEGGGETWADGNISFGGASPFAPGDDSTLGPQPLNSLVNEMLTLELFRGDPAYTALVTSIRIWQFSLILATDFRIEDVADQLAADCDYSFDNYAMSRTGSSDYCRAWETIYATLTKVFGIASGDVLAPGSWLSKAPSWHTSDQRLDFQLLQDTTGRDLLDRMATQASIWLFTNDSGDESPIFLDRLRQRSGGEAALDADFDEDNVASGSLTIDQGDEDDLFTRFRVRYNKSAFGAGFLDEVHVDEDGGSCTENTLINTVVSDWCDAAQDKHGVERELVFDADMIQDKATAEKLLKALAAKLVDRPWIARFRAPLEAIEWQLGDFPVLAHQTFLTLTQKYSNSAPLNLSFEETGADYKFVIDSYTYDREDMQVGDWIKASIVGTDLSGWYRITDIVVTSEVALVVDAPSGASGTYNVNSIEVYPAMMVTSQEIRGGSVEMELTEIPRDPS